MAPLTIFNVILASVLLNGCMSATGQTNRSAPVDQHDTNDMEKSDLKHYSNLDPQSDFDFLQKTTSLKWSSAFTRSCRLRSTDVHAHADVRRLLQRQAKLIEYTFSVKNHDVNPLLVNSTWTYKLQQWTRVSNSHGLTILSLAFNYGVLSLMTLSLGTAKLNVELAEEPVGCLLNLTESEKVKVLLDRVLSDLSNTGPFFIYDGEAVCHRTIQNQGGRAKFTYQCCYMERRTGLVRCLVNQPNTWLTVIKWLVTSMTVIVVLFGVLAVIMLFPGAGVGVIRYAVKLKEPLYKSLCVVRGGKTDEVGTIPEHRHFIDLRKETWKFIATKHVCRHLPSGWKIPVKISEYNILIKNNKLLPENNVHVGLVSSVFRAICRCEIRNISAVQDCCEANVCGCVREKNPTMWISVCKVVGKILVMLFLPVPFYVRLCMYIMFEQEEVLDRQRAVANVGLQNWFDFNILQWFSPVHPLFITAYVVYYIISLMLIYSSESKGSSRFKRIIADSFKDLNSLYWLAALRMLTRNFLWPFRAMGVFGVFFGLIYWPLVMPISAIACAIYCIPLTYVTCRMVINALRTGRHAKRDIELPGELSDGKKGMKRYEVENLMNACSLLEKRDRRTSHIIKAFTLERLTNLCFALIGIFTMCAVTLVVSECANFILHVCVFTLMGSIVNAGKVLKYGALLLMVVLYGYNCYNNVYRQYLKLNKALFSEIKGRIKDISQVTMLPSYLQQNRGFKSQENSEQAYYETEDDLSGGESKHWDINDLTLFVDNNDVPRIPKTLFEEVCDIEVPGSPGPVYQSLLAATGKMIMITLFLAFVFLIVLAFGDVYNISPTNQVIATMAGGSVPFVFMKLLRPAEPEIELQSVSFQSKLNEIVVNFRQSWPMYDFNFNIEEEPEEGKSDTGHSSGETTPNNKDTNVLSVKEDRFRMTQSVAELMEIPCEHGVSKTDVIETLEKAKSFGLADGQLVDIVIYLPQEEEPPYFNGLATPSGSQGHVEDADTFNN